MKVLPLAHVQEILMSTYILMLDIVYEDYV